MSPRLAHATVAPDTFAALSKLAGHLHHVFTDHKLKALVEVRVSQINGCAFCLDMHSNQARQLGEAQQRLDCLPAWREVPFYTVRERAALGWAEAVTLVSVDHVPDDVYEEAKAQFNDQELTNLTAVIGMINLWNRMSISFRSVPATKPATT